jgi:hypothetical protein
MKIIELLENQARTSMADNGVVFELDGGYIDIWPAAPHAPRDASVLDFNVPAESRNQGIGNRLVAMANKQFPDLGAQVSSLPSLKAFYNNGFRHPKLGNSSFDELVNAWYNNGGSLFVANTDKDGKSYTSKA